MKRIFKVVIALVLSVMLCIPLAACDTLLNVAGSVSNHNHVFEVVQTGDLCDPDGYTTYQCNCGQSIVVNNYMQHVYVGGVCIYCGQTSESAHSHKYEMERVGDVCDPDGYIIYRCECGDTYKAQNDGSHTFVNGTCIYCGAENVASISGYIYESDYAEIGAAGELNLSGVRITVTGEDNTVYSTSSDENGYYVFEKIACGKYTVTCSKDGYYNLTLEINLSEDTVRDIYLDAKQDSRLSGRVTIADSDMDQSNNAALSDAVITLQKLTGTDLFRRQTITDGNGNYYFDLLPAGNYILSAEKDGYLSVMQYITIAPGTTIVQNMVLEIVKEAEDESLTGSASGIIYDAGRQGEVGVAGLTLRIREGIGNTDRGEVVMTIITGDNGSYVAEGLKPGNYTVSISDERTGLTDESQRYNDTYFNIKVLPGTNIGNQNGYVSNNVYIGQIRIVLTWGLTPKDLDSHLTGPSVAGGRFHIYYSNKDYADIANLDRDDTDSYGPETTTIYGNIDGLYRFSVHDYSNKSSSSSTAMANSGAKVEVYFGEYLEYTFYVPEEAGTLWTVFEYDSVTGILTPINSMSYQSNESAIQ